MRLPGGKWEGQEGLEQEESKDHLMSEPEPEVPAVLEERVRSWGRRWSQRKRKRWREIRQPSLKDQS